MSQQDNIALPFLQVTRDDGITSLAITNDFINIDNLHQVYDLLKRISEIKNTHVNVTDNYTGYRKAKYTVALLDVIRLFDNMSDDFLKTRDLHPLITAFQKEFSKYDFYGRLYNGRIIKYDETQTAVMLNQLVENYRSEVHSASFKKQLKKYQRASIKNLRGVNNYINHLFNRHARLLVIRVDLSWKKDYVGNVTAGMAQNQRKQLFRNMKRNRIFKNVLGTVWKLEYGKDKGFHYHMLFLLNGNKSQSGITIGKQFGEYWEKVVTEGRGLYWNCNAVPERYKKCGVGMVKHDDTDKREGVQKAIEYLTKIDQFARLALPGGVRTFGRGEVKAAPKRGRKRQ